MLNYFRRTAQVVMLTCVLIFGTLLILGSFETTGWSDSHHGYGHTKTVHNDWIFWWYTGETIVHEEYSNGGHGNTSH